MAPRTAILFAASGLVLTLGCGSGSSDSGTDGLNAADSGAVIDASADADNPGPIQVVIFSKTAGFRHASIATGIGLIETLGAERGWIIRRTEDAAELTTGLDQTDVVVFCNTTGDILDDAQQGTFEAFIRGGGGYVGIHSATDTEYGWPFYGDLAGARFANHPAPQLATVRVESIDSPITGGLPAQFDLNDEWYNFAANPRGSVTVLATLDEATYTGGEMGGDHPIMWSNQIDQGRSFYTGLGHNDSTYVDAQFMASIAAAIEWTAGQ